MPPPRSRLPNKELSHSYCVTSLVGNLKPLLVSMKIVGMYFDPNPGKNKVEDSDTSSSRFSWRSSLFTGRVYCYSVSLLLWFNFIRGVVELFRSDGGLTFRLIITIGYLQCAINSTVIVVSCQRLGHLRTFYKLWDSLFKDTITQEIGCGFQCSPIYLNVSMVIGWVLFAVSIITVYAFLFGNLSGSQAIIASFVRPFPDTQGVTIFVAFAHIFESGAWIFPVIYLSVISRVVRAKFLQFRKCLSKQIDEADGCIPDRLPELKHHFMTLCQAVDIINGSFKWMLGVSFILQIAQACVISHVIINGPTEIYSLSSNLFWLVSCLVIVLTLAISSSGVHDAAHSLIEDIFLTGTKNATTDQLGQLNLFVAKLTGTSIGFTAVDFFVITREFLLTLAGLFGTYFFLLLQFRIA